MFSEPKRNHPTLILERTAYYLFALAAVALNALSAGTQDAAGIYSVAYWKSVLAELTRGNFQVLLSGAGLAVLLLALILISAFRWSKTFFRIEDGVLYTERRTLFHKLSRLPVGNITTINVERNIFEKLCGTSKVKIDINSSTTANKTDFTYVLSDSVARALKEELLALRDAGRGDAADLPPEPRTRIVAFSTADAVRHKLLSVPFLQIFTAAAVLVTFLQGFAESGSREDIYGVIVIPLVLYLFSLIIGILNLCGFTLDGDSKTLYITHGRFRLQSYAFEKKRVKAVFVKQSLLARIFRLYSVELAVVGLGNEKNESPRLCLLVKKKEAERILAAAVPEFHTDGSLQRSDKRALLPGFLLTGLCTAAAAGTMYFSSIPGAVLTGTVFAFGILASVLSQKTHTVAVGEHIFACSSGILNKKTGYFRYCDLQELRFGTNPCMKKGKIGRIRFSILAQQSAAVQRTGWFEKAIFENLTERTAAAPDASDE